MNISLPSWRTVTRSSLLFLAAALPVAFYLRTYDSAMIKISLLQLGVLTAVTAWLLGSLAEGRFEIPEPAIAFIMPAAFLLFWNALRFTFADYHLACLHGFLNEVTFLLSLLLALLSFSRRDIRLATMVILGGWLITVLYGISQHLGFDPFVWKNAFGDRVFSTFGNPMFFADYLMICMPLALAPALDRQLPRWLRISSGIAVVISCCVLAWTRTGAPWRVGTLAIMPVIFMILSWRALRDSRRILALALAGLCMAAAFKSATLSKDVVKDRTFLIETWKGTLTLIKSQPWVGSGPGSFLVKYPAFRRPTVILNEHTHNSETDHAENELLEQWVEGGIIGLGLWLWLVGVIFYKGWQLCALDMADDDRGYALGIATAAIGGLLSGLVPVGSISSRFPAPGWMLFFILALVGALYRSESGQTEKILALPSPFKSHRILFVLIAGAAAWSAWASLRIFQSDGHHNEAIYWSKKKDWDKALKEYDQEVPGAAYVMGQYFKGNVFLDRDGPGDTQRAVAQYRFVRSLAPNYVLVHLQEAKALRKLGRKEEAIEQLEAETRLDPVWDKPWHELSELYQEIGQPEKSTYAKQREDEAKKLWESGSDGH